MATAVAPSEELTGLKGEEAQSTSEVATSGATVSAEETKAEQTPEASSSSGDVKISDEEDRDKALRAVRQSTSIPDSPSCSSFHDHLSCFLHSRVLLCGRQPAL